MDETRVEGIGSKEDFLKQLEGIEMVEERQRVLNEMFPLDRKEKMIDQAPVDSLGLRVRYFREMPYEDFLRLIEKGELSAMDYFDGLKEGSKLNDKPSPDRIFYMLRRVLKSEEISDRNYFMNKMNQINNSEGEEKNKSYTECLKHVFPDAQEEEIDRLVKIGTLKEWLPFIEKYVPLKLRMSLHTGSYGQVFSTLLSLSVGGNRMAMIPEDWVVVEMVIPNPHIMVGGKKFVSEKEVYTSKINTKMVTRVYVDNDQLWDEVYLNPETQIGYYNQTIRKHSEEVSDASDWYKKYVLLEDSGDAWRHMVPTELCLPVDLKKQISTS